MTTTEQSPAEIVSAFLSATGLAEWTPIRVFVVGSPRITTSPIAPDWIDFEIDESRGGRWFRVTYSLILYGGKQIVCMSPSGIPIIPEADTIGSDPAKVPMSEARCNGYDLAFIDWFKRHGWQIHQTPSGISVWTNGDTKCPFTVTRGMIERLEWNGHIERIFPPGTATLDYVWQKTSR